MPSDPRSLVARELAPMLDVYPGLDFSRGIQPVRDAIDRIPPAPLPPELQGIDASERFVPGTAGSPDVRVLHYAPADAGTAPRPAILHIHGGGYILGAPETYDIHNRATVAALGVTLVSVAYRLAPETAWPGALEDCYAVLCWMHGNAAQLGIDPARMAIAGESAGGGHAAALAIHARDKARQDAGAPRICFQLLDSPMLDDRSGSTADPHPYTGHFIWTRELNRLGWRSLLGMEPGGPDVPPAAVPARVADLSDLPPACLVIGALDLFLEESLEYVRRLTRAGVPAELHVIPGAYHGYRMVRDAPQVAEGYALMRKALARALAAT